MSHIKIGEERGKNQTFILLFLNNLSPQGNRGVDEEKHLLIGIV